MNILYGCVSFLFIVFLSLPFVLTVCGIQIGGMDNRENRVLVEKPALNKTSLEKWPSVLDPWFQDGLTFRSHCVGLYLTIWEEWLSAPVKSAATGKNGELFPILSTAPVLQYYLGLQPIDPHEYIHFQLAHAGMYIFLKSKGIPYFLVTIPDKPTLYPEYLPFWTHWRKGESIHKQKVKAIQEIGIPWIDLLPILHTKKYEHALYNKTFDPGHMNGYGMEICHQYLVEALGKYFPALLSTTSKPAYRVCETKRYNTAFSSEWLSSIELLQIERFQSKEIPNLIKKEPQTWFEPQLIVNKDPLSPLNIVFSGDSYFLCSCQYAPFHRIWPGDLPLLAYYSEQFLKMNIQYLTVPFLKQLFDTGYKPDVVIEALAERNLGTPSRARKDSLLRTFGDIYLKTPMYFLTPKYIKNITNKESYNDITIYIYNNTVFLKASENPYIELPSLVTDAHGRAAVVANVFSPIQTYFGVYYTPKDIGFVQESSINWVKVEPGENLVHLYISTHPYQEISIRFHLGFDHNEYRILPIPDEIKQMQKFVSDSI